MYGTAWKEEQTQRLTELALEQGFRGIDTANQRRHYYEAAVGQGIATAISNELLTREDLFLQTKFTFRGGQDHRLPYDPRASITDQVAQSLASSLDHLNVESIDSFVLHGPSQRSGLGADDWEAWRAMELLHDKGIVRFLGVSNVDSRQLDQLVNNARIKPTFVQNRCFAIHGWDRQIRTICAKHGLTYQGFSLLTANREVLASRFVKQLATTYGRTIPQVVFRFAFDLGMIILTGTNSAEHMLDDLAIDDFRLSTEEITQLENIGIRPSADAD